MAPAFDESPIEIACGDSLLRGILHSSTHRGRRGVIIIVGGPQYRVGSHRQFVLLGRALAAAGIPTMRFDHRGIGDSEGEPTTFESLDDDIRAAVDAFRTRLPEITEIVLWGLCDGATAAAFYAPRDSRIRGLVLLNPWVRSDSTEAKTYITSYYATRLMQRAFWAKMLRGRVDIARSVLSALHWLRAAVRLKPRQSSSGSVLADRMLASLSSFSGRVMVVLSGRDLTAQEFITTVRGVPAWQRIAKRPVTTIVELAQADHTFSRQAWRDEVAELTARWVSSLESTPM